MEPGARLGGRASGIGSIMRFAWPNLSIRLTVAAILFMFWGGSLGAESECGDVNDLPCRTCPTKVAGDLQSRDVVRD